MFQDHRAPLPLCSEENIEDRPASPGVDEAAIQGQIVRVHVALDGIRKMSRLANEIRSAIWEIDDESDRLRHEIRDALRLIEDALRSHTSQEDVAKE